VSIHSAASTRLNRLACHFALALIAALALFLVQPAARAQNSPAPSVNADRWLEIDMYWFSRQDPARSAREFWDRFQPLYAGVTGYRGLILNIGWTVGPVMEWSGDLDQKISLPTGSGQARWVDERGPLTGTTAERKQKSEARFAGALVANRHGYGPWTYGDVQRLVADIKQEAGRRGISAFKVGMLNYAWTDAYGEVAPWVNRHPEAFTRRVAAQPENFDVGRYFDPAALLHADPTPLGGLPHGIAEGTPVHQSYSSQWGSLSRALSLDAIMLRDSFGMPIPYQRGGPWGPLAPSAQVIRQATEAVAALVKETKLANPAALVMMYSNAASAPADWRSNGFDLESIARQGYLDIWVDQTWAGAWNEVGIREGAFWNDPKLGWTFQLASMLTHAATLADTKVRHYPLVETFDAWESWDVLHSAPEKLRWGIWAYSHAAVKTPSGLKFPAGTYISWANQGERLLSQDDVSFLTSNINAAVTDARNTTAVFGPTLVYSRESMQWQADHATPNQDINEWIDEQLGSVIKWPVPMLSATRIEWLPRVQSDLFLVQTPSHLAPEHLATLTQLIQTGQPVALLGSFSSGIDPALLELAGLRAPSATAPSPLQICQAANQSPALVGNTPPTFTTWCRPETILALPGARVLYTQQSAPALTLATPTSSQTPASPQVAQVAAWNPPNLRQMEGIPLAQIWGNTGAPYALAAGLFNQMLARNGNLHVARIDLNQTVNLSAWRTRDGVTHLMAANLEEGLRDDADLARHTILVLPNSWKSQTWKDAWSGHALPSTNNTLSIDLPQATSVLLDSSH